MSKEQLIWMPYASTNYVSYSQRLYHDDPYTTRSYLINIEPKKDLFIGHIINYWVDKDNHIKHLSNQIISLAPNLDNNSLFAVDYHVGKPSYWIHSEGHLEYPVMLPTEFFSFKQCVPNSQIFNLNQSTHPTYKQFIQKCISKVQTLESIRSKYNYKNGWRFYKFMEFAKIEATKDNLIFGSGKFHDFYHSILKILNLPNGFSPRLPDFL